MIRSFIRLPKHKRFNYTPRVYDPVKEELNQRKQKIQSQVFKEFIHEETRQEEQYSYSTIERGSFRRSRVSPRQDVTSSLSTLALVLGMLIMLYGYFYLDGYEDISIYGGLSFFGAFIWWRIRQARKIRH